jgi:hypothetical protein
MRMALQCRWKLYSIDAGNSAAILYLVSEKYYIQIVKCTELIHCCLNLVNGN